MIVRIPGEGQFDVSAQFVDELNELDRMLVEAIDAGDEPAFQLGRERLAQRVRDAGVPVPVEVLAPSDAVVPPSGSTLAQVRAMLGDEGLIPG